MGLTFFGLTPEYRSHIFSQIHEIVFHGKGGYTWDAVYSMPIWLRNFTFKKIQEFYEKEKEEHEKAMEKARGTQKLTNSSPPVSRPNIPQPTYQTKASKK